MNRSDRRGRRDGTEPTPRRGLGAGDPAGRRLALVTPLAIAAATLLAYSNTFGAPAHFDDFAQIFENPSVRDPRLPWPPSGARWLGTLSFALNYRAGGPQVAGYHAVNVLIHLCNGLLVAWLSALTLRTPALRAAESGPLLRRYLPLAAGLLFAVHPVHTQAVTYLVQRYASLATLFYLLSIVLYARARLSLEAAPAPRARAAALHSLALLAAAAAAAKTKEIAFTLPWVAAGYELLLFRPPRRLALLLLAPLGAASLLVPLAHLGGAQTVGGALASATGGAHIGRWEYLLTQSRVVMTYLRLLVAPVGQNLDHDFPLSRSLAEPSAVTSVAALSAIAVGAVVLFRRARRANHAAGILAPIGIGWFFVTLSVESSFIPIRDVIFEHRMYLPDVGAAVALAAGALWGVERLRSGGRPALAARAALLVIAGALIAATYARNATWRDPVTLWSDAVAKSPRKGRPHLNLGRAYLEKGRLADAEREYLEAIRLDPSLPDAHNNLGVLQQGRGRVDDAIREYREAIRLAPGFAKAHDNLGQALESKGRLEDAVQEYRAALKANPGDPADVLDNLGNALVKLGRPGEAIPAFQLAIAALERSTHEPGSRARLAATRTNLGIALEDVGRVDDAMREHREATRLDPGRAEAHNNLGDLLRRQGRAAEAVEACRRAVALSPRPEFALALGFALEAAGRGPEAIPHYERFLEGGGEGSPDLGADVKARLARLRAAAPLP